MKLLNYTLVAVLGAFVASLVTYRLARHAEAPPAPIPAPVADVRHDTTRPIDPAFDDVIAKLERFTRENADLKAQLEAARVRQMEHDATLKTATEQLDELRRPMTADVLSSTLRAELKSGEVVVTGGYKLADGRRLYAFAKPIVAEVDGASVVKIEGCYLTLSDEVGRTVGLDNLATNAANTLQHGEVWVPGEEEAVFTQVNATPGTDILTYPSMALLPGRSGTISVGDIQLKVTPTLAEDGAGLGLELRLEQPQATSAAAE